jgi:YggT family protein
MGRTGMSTIGPFVTTFVGLLVTILQIAIIGRALLSWFPISPTSPIVTILNEITEPILAPLRRIVPRIGMIDITPMVAIFVLFIVQSVISSTF